MVTNSKLLIQRVGVLDTSAIKNNPHKPYWSCSSIKRVLNFVQRHPIDIGRGATLIFIITRPVHGIPNNELHVIGML